MSRLYKRPVRVITNNKGLPVAFYWRGFRRVLEIVDYRRMVGAWWEGESEKIFYRVLADPEWGLYDLYFDQAAGSWWMYRVWD